MVTFVVEGDLCSGRAACRALGLARSTFQYRMRPPTAERTRLVKRLHELSRKREWNDSTKPFSQGLAGVM